MLNHVNLRSQLNVEVFFCVFWGPFGPDAPKKLPKRFPTRIFEDCYAAFWEPPGHLWETFGDQGSPKAPKGVPKATQRLQGSPKGLRKDDMARLSR